MKEEDGIKGEEGRMKEEDGITEERSIKKTKR